MRETVPVVEEITERTGILLKHDWYEPFPTQPHPIEIIKISHTTCMINIIYLPAPNKESILQHLQSRIGPIPSVFR